MKKQIAATLLLLFSLPIMAGDRNDSIEQQSEQSSRWQGCFEKATNVTKHAWGHLCQHPKLYVGIAAGIAASGLGYLAYKKFTDLKNGIQCNDIVYTLKNSKRMRVQVNDVTKLNRFNAGTGTFDELNVDAVVNAANEECLGGGGIDGVIHSAIDKLLSAVKSRKYIFKDVCANLPELGDGKRCDTGDAKIVPGITLAKYVVQAVGPTGGTPNKEKLLESTYLASLQAVSQSQKKLAALFGLNNNRYKVSNRAIYDYYGIAKPTDYGIKSIAFPSISTGIFGYPKEDAARIAVDTVYNYLESQQTPIEEVRFILYIPNNPIETMKDYNRYVKLLNQKFKAFK